MDKMKHAISFATWIVDCAYEPIYSEKLGIRKYVDTAKYDVYVHDSDEHFTKMITNYGYTIEELYEIFNKI